ncbi:Glutathione S-transferase-like protein 4 [Elsinoe fawcettii]|nr:Glutathione S-transferase-like protein 4 [Elsinoe fawcettii]
MNLENRRLAYRKINPRGEVPALVLEDGTVLTETPAVCEYIDEIATSGQSLYGNTALERAETRMWLRRMDLEIVQPLTNWFRNDEATIDFYQGNRTPNPEARMQLKLQVNQGLNR